MIPPEYSAWLPPLEAFEEAVRARTLAFRDTPAGAFVMRLFRDERERVVAPVTSPVAAGATLP